MMQFTQKCMNIFSRLLIKKSSGYHFIVSCRFLRVRIILKTRHEYNDICKTVICHCLFWMIFLRFPLPEDRDQKKLWNIFWLKYTIDYDEMCWIVFHTNPCEGPFSYLTLSRYSIYRVYECIGSNARRRDFIDTLCMRKVLSVHVIEKKLIRSFMNISFLLLEQIISKNGLYLYHEKYSSW